MENQILNANCKIYDIIVNAWSELPELVLHGEFIDIEIDDIVIAIPLHELRIVKEQTIYCQKENCYIHITFV